MWCGKKKFLSVTFFVGHSKESLVTELQFLSLHPSLFPSRIKCQIACPHQILEDWSLKLSKGSHALSLFNEWYLLLMVVGLVFSLHHVDVESSWTSTCLGLSHLIIFSHFCFLRSPPLFVLLLLYPHQSIIICFAVIISSSINHYLFCCYMLINQG